MDEMKKTQTSSSSLYHLDMVYCYDRATYSGTLIIFVVFAMMSSAQWLKQKTRYLAAWLFASLDRCCRVAPMVKEWATNVGCRPDFCALRYRASRVDLGREDWATCVGRRPERLRL